MSSPLGLKGFNTEATENPEKSALFFSLAYSCHSLKQTLGALCGFSLSSYVKFESATQKVTKESQKTTENRLSFQGEPSFDNERESLVTDLSYISVQEAHVSVVRSTPQRRCVRWRCQMSVRIFRDRRSAKAPLTQRRGIIVWTIVNVEVWEFRVPSRVKCWRRNGDHQLPTYPIGAGPNTGMRRWFLAYSMRSTSGLGIRQVFDQRPRVLLIIPRGASLARTQRGSSWATVLSKAPFTTKRTSGDDRAHGGDDQGIYGKPPSGWMGPGLTETYDTTRLPQGCGIKYICDWVYDDEPTEISTKHGRFSHCPTRSNA